MQTLNFTPLAANATIWFANAAAWNSYMASITVTVPDASTYPTASLVAKGMVNMGVLVSYTYSALAATDSYVINMDSNGDGIDEVYSIPTLASFTELKSESIIVAQRLQALITSLKNAGIISLV